MESSRNMIISELVRRGDFTFAGYIQNEVRATTLVLFKAVAKWYGIPFDEANKITKEFAEQLAEESYTGWLKQACDMFGFDWEDNWDIVEKKMNFCYKYDRIPYNKSSAASGVIMIDGEALVPVRDGVVMYNGSDLEKFKYIKYDILTVTTIDMIQHFYGIDYDWNQVYDSNVWDTICSGDTDFVFQFASPGMKRILTSTKPRDINALAEINALYRPGPIEAGFVDKYIKIKTGEDPEFTEEEEILCRVLKEVFGESHPGLIIFQEDVMKICEVCANFTLTEADDIRRAMGKKDEKALVPFKQQFLDNWNEGGDPEKVWKALEGFAHYAFNKSHSVAYAIIAYATAKLWTYQKYELLEYCLNDGTKDNYALAMNKCKELNIKMDYPTLETMGDKKFHIAEEKTEWGDTRAVLHIPIDVEKSYSSYVSFLFDNEINVASLIYKGVCDKLTGDRTALAELVTTLLAKPKAQALYMEPPGQQFNRLEQILDGLKMCEAIVSYEKQPNGCILVKVKRANGKPSNEVLFHPNGSDAVRAQKVLYDLKMFGSVRNGVISNRPHIEHARLESNLMSIKEKAYENGQGNEAYKKMRNFLEHHMYNYFSDPRKNTFYDVYALINDTITYGNSVKLFVEFNDCQDILYVKTEELMNKARTLGKNALVKLTLVYSPYINKRKEVFVYDFDIKEMEVV